MHAFEQTAAFIVEKAADKTIILGPVVWREDDQAADGKEWYFMVSTADADKQWHCDKVSTGAKSKRKAEEIRAGIMIALAGHHPLVMMDFDDELKAAEFCEAIWPGERITRVRKTVEAERAQARP